MYHMWGNFQGITILRKDEKSNFPESNFTKS